MFYSLLALAVLFALLLALLIYALCVRSGPIILIAMTLMAVVALMALSVYQAGAISRVPVTV